MRTRIPYLCKCPMMMDGSTIARFSILVTVFYSPLFRHFDKLHRKYNFSNNITSNIDFICPLLADICQTSCAAQILSRAF